MGKEKITIPQPEVIESGKLTDEQMAQLKQQHGDVYVIKIKERNEQHLVIHYGYLKPAGRNEIAVAMMKQQQNMTVEAGEVFLKNCWLGGSELLRNPITRNDELLGVRAATLAFAVMELPDGEITKN